MAGCFIAAGSGIGCGEPEFLADPLHRAEERAQGPESPSVAVGPLHRAGQPCGACHRHDGSAGPFLVAGTVYRDPKATVAVADVDVRLVDSAGMKFLTKTNCVGNFYVRPSEFHAVLPLWVSVQLGEFPWEMASPIHREVSCAKCHSDPAGPTSAGHIFVTDDETIFPTIPMRACAPADGVSR
ncbi:MAG: hypothetical protein ABUL77_02060 [Bacteroidota bacterium]